MKQSVDHIWNTLEFVVVVVLWCHGTSTDSMKCASAERNSIGRRNDETVI